ncbi:MAG TPA: hypothetical protein VGX96_12260 [Candidatus Elarobacter sp.]|nr:hypothetical protein [Candidatus Elarobacter sp.]
MVVSTGTTITAFACGERAPTEGVETFDSSFIVDREFVHAPLPEFAETPGVSLAAAGPAIGRSTSEARVTSSLGLTAVFESFASQLRRAGWSPKASASTAGLRSQTFTKTVEGKPCIAVLTINALDATHYMALADVTRIKN